MEGIIKNKLYKKIIAGIMVVAMSVTSIPVIAAEQGPSISVSGPSSVANGGTAVYTANFKGATTVDLTQSDAAKLIRLNGFTGNIAVEGSGNKSRTIKISNIKGSGSNNSVTILEGAVIDDDINDSPEVTSNKLTIVSANTNKTATDTNNNGNNNNTNNNTNNNSNNSNSNNTNINNINNGGSTETPSSNNNTDHQINTVSPTAIITGACYDKVYEGDTISFNVEFSDDIRVATVDLTQQDATKLVRLNGFTGTIAIEGNGNSSRKVVIYNVQGTGDNKSITILEGAALDDDINMTNETTSCAFTISKKDTPAQPQQNTPEPKQEQQIQEQVQQPSQNVVKNPYTGK